MKINPVINLLNKYLLLITYHLFQNDKDYVKKIVEIEKKLETVNIMYHHITTQKAIVKVECEVFINFIYKN